MTTGKNRSRDRLRIVGPNQISLLRALLHAPGNQFETLAAWYQSEEVVGGSRESRRQSCWRVINAGWATAFAFGRGWVCTLTPTGKDIAEGKVKVYVRDRLPRLNRHENPNGSRT